MIDSISEAIMIFLYFVLLGKKMTDSCAHIEYILRILRDFGILINSEIRDSLLIEMFWDGLRNLVIL